MFNLLENAIKYADSDPAKFRIEISARGLQNGYYEVSFTDSGCGVSPAHEEKIFEVGYRHPEVIDIPGDGLGLARARKFVEMHAGTLRCVAAVDSK
ncbi:MAG: sensor histidine kinase [Planctomycetota bacterium]|nr:sensor histidine kinase [Planctomycetota bacterium]